MSSRRIPSALRTTGVALALAMSFAACSTETDGSSDAARDGSAIVAPGAAESGTAAPVEAASDPSGAATSESDPTSTGSQENGSTGTGSGGTGAPGTVPTAVSPVLDPPAPSAAPAAPSDETDRLAVVSTAAGEIELADAELETVVDDDGRTSVVGRARLPFPTDGVMAQAQIEHLPIGDVGMASGHELAHLGAHLNDERQYLFFSFDGGLDVRLPFGGTPGYEAIPPAITVPAGQSAVMVVDPTDPYFYVGTDCPDIESESESDSGRDDVDRDDDDRDDQNDAAPSALVTLEPTDLDAGQECGIGISMNGNIPAPAMPGRAAFTGHVVVDGIVPLYAGLELDGSVVVALRDPGVQTVGWGNVVATVPLFDDLLDVRIPLANASVEIQADETRIGVAYAGTIGGQDPTYELPVIGLPVTIPADGAVRWEAQLGFVNSGNGWSIDADSYAALEGEVGLGLGSFGEMIGLDLSDLATQEGSLRIDRNGVHVSGRSTVQLHPALVTGGAVAIDMTLSAHDWREHRLEFAADVDVPGHRVAAADVRLDGNGLSVAGRLDLGLAAVDVAGVVTSTGFELTGSTEVRVDLDALADASRAVSGKIDVAIAEVERLDVAIEQAREDVRESRRIRDAGFASTQQGLDEAIASLAEIDDKVAANEARIAELEHKIADEKGWYDSLGGAEKAWKWTGHQARLAAWRTEIAAKFAANVTQRDVYRPAADAVLETAKKLLQKVQDGLDALPVDTNPKVAGLIVLRTAAVETLELVRSGVELFEIEGSIGGSITVTLASTGASASFVGEVCGPRGCTTLAGGRVELGAAPRLCVELPGLGEQCLAI